MPGHGECELLLLPLWFTHFKLEAISYSTNGCQSWPIISRLLNLCKSGSHSHRGISQPEKYPRRLLSPQCLDWQDNYLVPKWTCSSPSLTIPFMSIFSTQQPSYPLNLLLCFMSLHHAFVSYSRQLSNTHIPLSLVSWEIQLENIFRTIAHF